MWMQWDPYPTAEDESEVGVASWLGVGETHKTVNQKIFHQKFILQAPRYQIHSTPAPCL